MGRVIALKIKRSDVLLLAAVLIAAGALLLWSIGGRRAAARAVVYVDGRAVCELSLDREEEFDWEGRVTIESGRGGVCIVASDCPDQLCVRQGEIRSLGQTVTCLPNRLTVLLTGDGDALDAMV